ncbi:EamA family transporter [uncultured Desulfuromonas sp.]|uniref:EamA family transporter n=1 Tax=uncultured Desulfuromonas sp. TaxID=181013 RepID=UPI002AAB60F3|nr:EamA family transporter [uncultured Desulfuromonas sp.]
MDAIALFFIVFSALMHALWNLQVKQSRDKTVFIWWMFITSGFLLNVVLVFLPGSFPVPHGLTWLWAIIGAICFVLYHLCNGIAYRQGDLSLTYPLAQTSMIYVPLWGAFFLHEQLTVGGILGVLCVVAGAYCVQLPDFSLHSILRPLRNLSNSSVRAALAAGFIYSIGSVADKSGVMGYSPFYFTYILVMLMVVIMSLNLSRNRYRGRILPEWRQHKRLILSSGPVMLGSFLTFRYGLSLAPVSYAVPVRQVNVLFGVLIGVLFLHESCGRMRLTAACLILLGVLTIHLGG